MNRDDDLNVPNLGPAEPVGDAHSHAQSVHTETRETRKAAVQPEPASGSGFIQPLVIIILIVAVCGLGYFSFDMYQAQQTGASTTQEAKQQIARLEALLKQAEQGAAESGEKLQGDVTSLESALKQKDKQLDSEIAKLWVVAHQTNKPAIAEQSKQLAELKKTLDSQAKALQDQSKAFQDQAKRLKSLQSSVAKQDKQIKAAQAVKGEADKLKAQLSKEITQLSKLIARIETSTQTSVEVIQEQLDEQVVQQRDNSDRIIKLEGRSNSDLERRVKQNAQAVQAFDGTRRQLSQDMLLVKQKLNNLQLLLEKK